VQHNNKRINNHLPISMLEKEILESFRSKRSRLQILAEILETCRKPQAKSRIMYKNNLSYNLLQDCLTELQKKKLIKVHHSKEEYSTTEKGQKFFQKWTELQQLLITKKPLQSVPPLLNVSDDWSKFRNKYFR
jgi:predicted transcriptional regulator